MKDLRQWHRKLYDLLIKLNKEEEKPLVIGFPPEKKSNYLLSIASDTTHRSFVLVRYEDETEIKPEMNESIRSVEIVSYSTTSLPVNEVISHLVTIINEYAVDSQFMIMIRRNDSGSIFNEHLRRLYRGDEEIMLFPTAKYSESGEIVIDKIGHGWKQTKKDEELCQSCMKDALVNKYFIFSSDRSEHCFESLRFKDPKEKESKDRFWFTWGMIAFVRHNRLKIFQSREFDENMYLSEKYKDKVHRIRSNSLYV